MALFTFSSLVNGQHLTFNPTADVLRFGNVADSASAVRLTISGANLGFTYAGKTVWLDATTIGQLSLTNVTFANGSILGIGDGTTDTFADWYGQEYTLGGSTVGNQIWGLGGADVITTGSGADYLVGNEALTPLNHVSRFGASGSPTNSGHPTISADGRFVAFEGGWTSFGSTNNTSTDVLVKDMQLGTVNNEHENSTGDNGGFGSGLPTISADGKLLAFESASSNLVADFSGANYDIYVSAVGGSAIERASTGTNGTLALDGRSENPDMSRDGRYVVFESSTSNWASGGSIATTDIFLKDRGDGGIAGTDGTLTRISTSTTGTDGNGESVNAKISADGRFVVFQSAASNLTTGDTNGYSDIFVWDRYDITNANKLTNITKDMVTVSNPNNGNIRPDLAYDSGWGGVVVFETGKNLVAQDTNAQTDIYAYNVFDDSIQLVSSKADGTGVSLSSEEASVSGDGRFVVFQSGATNLTAGDSNGFQDIFVKDLHNGEIALVSKSAAGVAADGSSSHAQISLGGDWIVFESSASNLASTDGNAFLSDVFRVSNPLLKDILKGGTGNDTYVLSRADIVQEQVNGGIDTIQSSISFSLVDTDGSGALGGNVENLTLTGTANLSGTGNTLNNVITGNAGNNILNGGLGIDTVSYAAATAAVAVNLSSTLAQNTVGASTDTLSGFENLTGSNFNDTLIGNTVANVLNGGLGADTMLGLGSNDVYYVDNLLDKVYETTTTVSGIDAGGIDAINASVSWTLGSFVENLQLIGATSINGTGNTLNNTITGNAGNNILNGGLGVDTVSYATATAAVAVNLGSTLAQNTVGAGTDTLTGFENLTGSNFNDTLTGNTGANVLNGGLGIDTVSYAAATAAVAVNLSSTLAQNTVGAGTDTLSGFENLTGSNFNDTLTGNASNNVLNGGLSADTMLGLGSNDVYYVDNLLDKVYETTTTVSGIDAGGIDAINASVSWTLGSFVENLQLIGAASINGTGNTLNNTITGNAGNNILNGGLGIDTVSYAAATAAVAVYLGSTLAQNTFGAGTDTLSGFENLTGSNFNDTLTGNASNNVLNGGAGNDTLNGSLGNDYLSGGTGVDIFRFNTALNASTNKDTIIDFSLVDDTIQFENAIFTNLLSTGALAAGNFRSSSTGVAADSNDYVLYNTTTGALSYDIDGNGAGAAVQIAVVGVSTHPALTAADFVVI
jgi:Ca2+-binding RTX toxin-like protein